MKVPAAGEDRKFVVFGALDYASGRIVYSRSEQKGEAAFIAFLEQLVQAFPAGEPVVLVLDNAGYHKSHELRAWWQQHADQFKPFWLPAYTPQLNLIERVYAVLDNLSAHHADDVLLFCLTHPRWEFVFQPRYTASLNLIEPWWKVVRSLAFKGRRFETWEEMAAAVHEATAYWNAHKYPFVWGLRRRHRLARRSGIGLMPNVP